MYVIGIDVSKYKHDCIIMHEDTGEIVRDVFSFDNSRAGFVQFISVLKTLNPTLKKKIGFETTGHYQDNETSPKILLKESKIKRGNF